MTIYILTNDQIPGEIHLHVDDDKKVRCDFTKSDATAAQQSFLLQHAELGMEAIRRITKGSKLVEMDVTFDMFWNRYDDKLLSSRKRSEHKWNRMTPYQQKCAYNHIPKYFAALPNGVRKKMAETYLNAEQWSN